MLTNKNRKNERTVFDITMLVIPDCLHDHSDALSDLQERIK